MGSPQTTTVTAAPLPDDKRGVSVRTSMRSQHGTGRTGLALARRTPFGQSKRSIQAFWRGNHGKGWRKRGGGLKRSIWNVAGLFRKKIWSVGFVGMGTPLSQGKARGGAGMALSASLSRAIDSLTVEPAGFGVGPRPLSYRDWLRRVAAVTFPPVQGLPVKVNIPSLFKTSAMSANDKGFMSRRFLLSCLMRAKTALPWSVS